MERIAIGIKPTIYILDTSTIEFPSFDEIRSWLGVAKERPISKVKYFLSQDEVECLYYDLKPSESLKITFDQDDVDTEIFDLNTPIDFEVAWYEEGPQGSNMKEKFVGAKMLPSIILPENTNKPWLYKLVDNAYKEEA